MRSRATVAVLAALSSGACGGTYGTSDNELATIPASSPHHGSDASVDTDALQPYVDAATAADGGCLFCDDFEKPTLDARWTLLLTGGSVKLATGSARSGARRLVATFGSVPASGRARTRVALSVPRLSVRAWVRLPIDGYPTRVGLLSVQRADGSSVDVIARDEGHELARVADGTETSLGPIVLGAWRCIALDVEGGVAALEVGLTYAGGANPNASIGVSYDDVAASTKPLLCE